jgi:hypothetical protein
MTTENKNNSQKLNWASVILLTFFCAAILYIIVRADKLLTAIFSPSPIIITQSETHHPVQIKDGEGKLVVAEMTEIVEVARSKSRSWLPDLTSSIRCKAVFRYYVQNSGPWEFAIKDFVCTVTAPQYQSFPVTSFDTATMEKKTDGGWLPWGVKDELAALEKNLTKALDEMAETKERRDLVRDKCKKSVEELTRQWLRLQGHDQKVKSIVVIFPDEIDSSGTPEATDRPHPSVKFL